MGRLTHGRQPQANGTLIWTIRFGAYLGEDPDTSCAFRASRSPRTRSSNARRGDAGLAPAPLQGLTTIWSWVLGFISATNAFSMPSSGTKLDSERRGFTEIFPDLIISSEIFQSPGLDPQLE